MIQQRKWWLLPSLFTYILFLAGCGDPSLSALIPAGPVAEEQLALIKLSLYIMIGVMLVVFFIYGYVIVKFRQRPGDDEIPEQVEGNLKLEITWTVIPILLLIVLAIPTVVSTFQLTADYPERELTPEELEEADLLVSVVAHQFWWEIEYPEYGVFTAQELFIPTNRKVILELTSNDVIHSFWVPPLAGKKDTNPGFSNYIWLQADEPGLYEGRCAELCGQSHALMNFRVMAVEQDEFLEWIQSMQDFTPDQMETELAAEGREIFQQSCVVCHSLQPDTRNAAGPSLVGFGDRTFLAGYMEFTEENLANWIAEPHVYKPEALMPAAHQLGLDERDVDALVEYLINLHR